MLSDDALSAFVRHEPHFHSQYLLFLDDHAIADDDTQSAFLFLCWYFVYGRNFYATALVVPDDIRDLFWRYNSTHDDLFMRYVAEIAGRENDANLHTWFVREALVDYGLAPLLGRDALGQIGRRVRPHERRTTFDDMLARASQAAASDPTLPSVSIVGLHRSVLGLGEEVRAMVDSLCDAGILPELVDVSPQSLTKDGAVERYKAFESKRPRAPIVIFSLPPFEMMRAVSRLDLRKADTGQYWIGHWFWETTALPTRWRIAYDAVDELWASSGFLRDLFRSETAKPVTRMPSHVQVEAAVLPDDLRDLFGERFTFITVFDFNSFVSRKNPLGTIEAFRRAFPAHVSDVQLILKTINGDARPDDFRRVTDAIGDDDRIVLVDGAIPKAEVCGLIAASDCCVSLHRAEGFGRPIVEAMLLGTPVIATAWSGPADFLTVETGFPVASTLCDVAAGDYAYAAGRWAEPDLDMAARHMRTVYQSPHIVSRIVAAARSDATERFGRGRIAAMLRQRLTAIAAQRPVRRS